MRELFLRILSVSAMGAAAGCALLAVAWLFRKKIPPLTVHLIWAVLLVRLLVPSTLPSGLSAYSAIGRAVELASQTERAPHSGRRPRPSNLPGMRGRRGRSGRAGECLLPRGSPQGCWISRRGNSPLEPTGIRGGVCLGRGGRCGSAVVCAGKCLCGAESAGKGPELP